MNRHINGIVLISSGLLPTLSTVKKAGHANRKFSTPKPRVKSSAMRVEFGALIWLPDHVVEKIVDE
jgi:hypothetical protein